MKRIVLFALLFALGCAKTPLDRAKITVKEYVKTMLNEPKQYEDVSWGKLDSAYYDLFSETPRGSKLDDSCKASFFEDNSIERKYLREIDGKDYDSKSAIWAKYINVKYGKMTREKFDVIYDSLMKPYMAERTAYYKHDPVFRGYKIDHSFRIKGQKKDKVLVKYRFYLDSTLAVEKAEDLDIDAIDQKNESTN